MAVESQNGDINSWISFLSKTKNKHSQTKFFNTKSYIEQSAGSGIMIPAIFWSTQSGLVTAGALITFGSFVLAFIMFGCLLLVHHKRSTSTTGTADSEYARRTTIFVDNQTDCLCSHSLEPPSYDSLMRGDVV